MIVAMKMHELFKNRRGLSIHTFHGNLFVRSTDLLSLPNCNPDAGFGMQVSIDEDLRDFQTVCFQAALLYTSSKGGSMTLIFSILQVTNLFFLCCFQENVESVCTRSVSQWVRPWGT